MVAQSAIYVLQVLAGSEQQFLRLAGRQLKRDGIADTAIHWPRRALKIRRAGRVVDAVARIPGLIRVLPQTAHAKPLDNYDLALIRHLIGCGAVIKRSRVSLAPGARIVVHAGPLKSMEGRIVKVDVRKKRVKVRLDLYGDAFLVDFGIDVLQSNDQRSVA